MRGTTSTERQLRHLNLARCVNKRDKLVILPVIREVSTSARENTCELSHDFGFSDRLSGARVGLITKRSNAKPKQFHNYFPHSVESCSTVIISRTFFLFLFPIASSFLKKL